MFKIQFSEKVWKVEGKKNKQFYALKEMSKAKYYSFFSEFSALRLAFFNIFQNNFKKKCQFSYE